MRDGPQGGPRESKPYHSAGCEESIADALLRLERRGLIKRSRSRLRAGNRFWGICLGMQLLFDKSYENGEYKALGLVKGEVSPFQLENMRVPHMGWNSLL